MKSALYLFVSCFLFCRTKLENARRRRCKRQAEPSQAKPCLTVVARAQLPALPEHLYDPSAWTSTFWCNIKECVLSTGKMLHLSEAPCGWRRLEGVGCSILPSCMVNDLCDIIPICALSTDSRISIETLATGPRSNVV